MSPELQAAILAAIISTIASIGVMAKMLPGILQEREDEREARLQDELKQRDLARKRELAEMRTDFEQGRAQVAMFNSVAEQLKVMTGALINTQAQGLERDRIISANTNAVGDVTEALADMAERLGVLFHTGTPNVVKKLDEIAIMIQSTEIKVNALSGNSIDLLMDVRDRLSGLETQVKEKIKQAEKHISKPIEVVKIDKDQLDNPADGTPPA